MHMGGIRDMIRIGSDRNALAISRDAGSESGCEVRADKRDLPARPMTAFGLAGGCPWGSVAILQGKLLWWEVSHGFDCAETLQKDVTNFVHSAP